MKKQSRVLQTVLFGLAGLLTIGIAGANGSVYTTSSQKQSLARQAELTKIGELAAGLQQRALEAGTVKDTDLVHENVLHQSYEMKAAIKKLSEDKLEAYEDQLLQNELKLATNQLATSSAGYVELHKETAMSQEAKIMLIGDIRNATKDVETTVKRLIAYERGQPLVSTKLD